jgi:hypothetical protein
VSSEGARYEALRSVLIAVLVLWLIGVPLGLFIALV